MAVTVKRIQQTGNDTVTGKAIAEVELYCDTRDELIDFTETSDGLIFAQGSAAWVIGEGIVAGLTSESAWVNQKNGSVIE